MAWFCVYVAKFEWTTVRQVFWKSRRMNIHNESIASRRRQSFTNLFKSSCALLICFLMNSISTEALEMKPFRFFFWTEAIDKFVKPPHSYHLKWFVFHRYTLFELAFFLKHSNIPFVRRYFKILWISSNKAHCTIPFLFTTTTMFFNVTYLEVVAHNFNTHLRDLKSRIVQIPGFPSIRFVSSHPSSIIH